MKRGRPEEEVLIKKRSVHFLLDEIRWNSLKEIAKIKSTSVSDILRELVDGFLDKEGFIYEDLLEKYLRNKS